MYNFFFQFFGNVRDVPISYVKQMIVFITNPIRKNKRAYRKVNQFYVIETYKDEIGNPERMDRSFWTEIT